MRCVALATLLTITLASPVIGRAQNYLLQAGDPSFAVNVPVPNGYINIANGNLHLEIPVSNLKQRGNLQLDERLVYDSRIWQIVQYNHYYWWPINIPNSAAGWRFIKGNEGYISYTSVSTFTSPCDLDGGASDTITYVSAGIVWTDPTGTAHPFDAALSTYNDPCDPESSQIISGGYATDASGYQVQDDGTGNPIVLDPTGNQVYPSVIDRFGNQWSNDPNGNLIDDLGRTPVIATTNGNVTYYDVLAPNGTIENNGARIRYIVTTEEVPLYTSFGQQDVVEYQNNGAHPTTITAIQSIELPDGSSYQFGYDSYAAIQSMSLPTGGVVTFQWNNYTDSYQNVNHWISSSTVDSNTTTYTPSVVSECASNGTGCQEQVNVHRPSGDEAVYLLTLNNGAWNVNTTVYAGLASASQAKLAVSTTYNFTNVCNNSQVCAGAQYITKSTETDLLPDAGLQTQVQSQYDNPVTGQLTSWSQWDYFSTGTSPSTLPTRQVNYGYTGFDLTSETHYDQTGNIASSTTYNYTGTATSTSGIVGHGSVNAGGPYLTSISRTNNSPAQTLTANSTYDDTGAIQTFKDYMGNITTYKYDPTDTFVTETDMPSTTSSSGIVAQHITKASYDTNSGALLSTDDQNSVAHGQAYSVYYSYEPVAGRPYQITYPDGGSVTYTYPTTNQTNTTVAQNASSSVTSTSIVDSYGRSYEVLAGGISSETTYDGNGRPYTVSNPHTAATTSTDGITYTYYDTLDRVSSIQLPDGNSRTYTYSGNNLTVQDELGNQKIETFDAFGEIVSVTETAPAPSNGPNRNPFRLTTSYQYDGLGNVTCIEQVGAFPGTGCSSPPSADLTSAWRVRRFYYNALSQLRAAEIPEHMSLPSSPPSRNCGTPDNSSQWTDCYSYDANGNRTSATDNSGATNIFSFDALNRLISETSGSVNTQFAYDGGTNASGRLGAQASYPNGGGSTTPIAESTYGYDVVGRVTSESSCRPGTCGLSGNAFHTTFATYDYSGNLTSIAYPDGRVVQNAYDFLNRPLLVANRQWGAQVAGSTYWYAPSYASPGELTSVTYGNGMQMEASFNSRQSISSLAYFKQSCAPIFSKSYQWDKNAINLTAEPDRITGLTRQFGYDHLNRLVSAVDMTSGGAVATNGLNQQYSLDNWGNLGQMGGSSGFSQSINNQNQVSTYGYDAAGRLLNDGFTQYTYDSNGMLTTSSEGAAYYYDGADQRASVVLNGVENDYYYFGGRLYAIDNPAGWTDLIYAGNQRIAEVAGTQTATAVYDVLDHIGSEVATVDSSGSVISAMDYTPFGQLLSGTNMDGFVFAGLLRDKDGLDHATMRQYSSVTGRWSTPDPYDGSYSLDDPQSFNRYAYVGNRPLGEIDPSGEYMLAPIYPDLTTDLILGLIDLAALGLDLFAGSEPALSQQQLDAQHAGKTTRECITCSMHSGQPTPPNDPAITAGSNYPPPGFYLLNHGDPPYHGRAPNRDVPIGINIFNCPNSSGQDPCANTWKQSNCVVNTPFKTAAEDTGVAAAGAGVVGAVGARGTGFLGAVRGIGEVIGHEAFGLVTSVGTALHVYYNTANALLNGCPNE